MKHIVLIVALSMALAACSKGMSTEKFIDTVAALSCAHTVETTAEGEKILKEKGVTPEQLQKFKQEMDPSKTMDIATAIAKRVAECHGLSLDKPEAEKGK